VKDRSGYAAVTWRGAVRKLPRLVLEYGWDITNRSSGRVSVGGEREFDGVAIAMRLSRKGGSLSGAISGCGKEWLEWADVLIDHPPRLNDEVEVGVFVSPDATRTVEATFSDFKLTTSNR
jgi:hypothetical protein